MSQQDRYSDDDPRKVRKCRAKRAKTKEPCGRWAIRGGYTCQTHGGGAPQVKRKAKERLADLIDPERLLREMAAIAYFDPRDLLDKKTGQLLDMKDWPDHVAKAVSGIEVIRGNTDAGDGKFDQVIKPRIWDKSKFVEMLAKHLKLFSDKQEVDTKIEISWKKD